MLIFSSTWNLVTGERLELKGWGPTQSSECLLCVTIAFNTSLPDPQGWAIN